ncbi:hypothetical protein HK101_002734, partial [Irineochytrium annulatum]
MEANGAQEEAPAVQNVLPLKSPDVSLMLGLHSEPNPRPVVNPHSEATPHLELAPHIEADPPFVDAPQFEEPQHVPPEAAQGPEAVSQQPETHPEAHPEGEEVEEEEEMSEGFVVPPMPMSGEASSATATAAPEGNDPEDQSMEIDDDQQIPDDYQAQAAQTVTATADGTLVADSQSSYSSSELDQQQQYAAYASYQAYMAYAAGYQNAQGTSPYLVDASGAIVYDSSNSIATAVQDATDAAGQSVAVTESGTSQPETYGVSKKAARRGGNFTLESGPPVGHPLWEEQQRQLKGEGPESKPDRGGRGGSRGGRAGRDDRRGDRGVGGRDAKSVRGGSGVGNGAVGIGESEFAPPGSVKSPEAEAIADIARRAEGAYAAGDENPNAFHPKFTVSFNCPPGVISRLPANARLFLGNLASEKTTKFEIAAIFANYGTIVEILLKSSFGFVQFTDPVACQEAIRQEQGRS